VATGYLPEKDASGKDKWPRGEEKVWREGMRTIDRGELTTFVFVFPHDRNTYKNTDVDQVTKSVVNHVQTSLARQCYNLGTTLPLDPSIEVIRYQPTQMTSEPIKQQLSRSGMISL
jgi:hypothetical protein